MSKGLRAASCCMCRPRLANVTPKANKHLSAMELLTTLDRAGAADKERVEEAANSICDKNTPLDQVSLIPFQKSAYSSIPEFDGTHV